MCSLGSKIIKKVHNQAGRCSKCGPSQHIHIHIYGRACVCACVHKARMLVYVAKALCVRDAEEQVLVCTFIPRLHYTYHGDLYHSTGMIYMLILEQIYWVFRWKFLEMCNYILDVRFMCN